MLRAHQRTAHVALAFSVDSSGKLMQNGPKLVFAFLPVRHFGLRFALHADFDVVAGRDDLVADSSQNEWLQSEAAGNFCDMLLSSKCMQVESAAAWLQFVPLRHEVSPTL